MKPHIGKNNHPTNCPPTMVSPSATKLRSRLAEFFLRHTSAVLALLCLCAGLATARAVDTNILFNAGFELGQTGWTAAIRGGTCVIVTNPAVAHTGNSYSSNFNAGGWSSCAQGGNNNGNANAWNTGVSLPISDAKFYQLRAFVKVPGASAAPQDVTLRYRFEPSGNRVDVGQQTIATEDWTELQSGWISSGAGDTWLSYFEVHTVVNGVVYYADDCAMIQSDGYPITGVVKATNGLPVVGATVQLKKNGNLIRTTTSGAGGAYTFAVQPVAGENYDLNANKLSYQSPDTAVTVVSAAAGTVVPEIVLTNLPLGTISGIVTNALTGGPIVGATITVRGDAGSVSTTTDANGLYSIGVASDVGYFVTAAKFPLTAPAQTVLPTSGGTVDAGFALTTSMQVAVYSGDLTNLTNNAAVEIWTNRGVLGGVFISAVAAKPTYTQQGVYKAANFKSSAMILSNDSGVIPAPGEITGSSANYTVSAWLYDSSLPAEQSYICWAKRGGPDGAVAQFNYSANPSYGAVTHWGAPDMGFTATPSAATWHHVAVVWDSIAGVEKLYVDGALDKSSPVKTLSIGSGMPVMLGAAYWNADGTSPDLQLGQFNAAGAFLSQVEVYSSVASAADVYGLFTNSPPSYAAGAIAVKVVTDDASSAQNYAVKVTTGAGGIAAAGNTDAGGNYSATVPPGTYTVSVVKAGSVINPGSRSAAVTANATNVLANFIASPSSIRGELVDAVSGLPIYNGIVQVGGSGGTAVVTDANGKFSFSAAGGAGGVEIFADALGYHCTNLLVTSTGGLYKKIALVPQAEPGSVVNGGFETEAGGPPVQPTGWGENAWSPGALVYYGTNDAYSGSYSCWFSGTGAFAPLAQYMPLTSGYVYNCYFKTKADTAITDWFPMFSFRNDADGELKGWISGEPGLSEWAHNPPKTWTQYLQFKTYSGDATQPFVRIAPPSGATVLAATFCFTVTPASGSGCYVDDLVMDAVPATVPSVATTPDPIIVSAQKTGANLQLSWPVGALLQSTNVSGPWTTNTSAVSPYTVTNSGAGNMFFKILVQ